MSQPISPVPSAPSSAHLAPAVPPALSATDVTKTYGSGSTAVHALRGISLDIAAGQLTVVMGPSGSGKSTLLHCLAGLDTATTGRITVGSTTITDLDDDTLTEFRRDHVGFVFQSFNLVPTLTAAENIILPDRLARRKSDPASFDAVVAALGIGDRLGHKPHELSGGEQQRVAVARALLGRPAVLFADEPTGNLDSVNSAETLGLLRDAVDRLGQTVVMVTHNRDSAAIGDRIVVVTDGLISADRTQEAVLAGVAE